MPAPRLKVSGVSKTFGSVRVLDDVELEVQPGEVHALVGQNGSGKSTLIKILTGYYTPDRGASVALDGEALRLPVQWDDARRAGLSVVHQDLGLLDQLTVAENICVGDYIVGRYSRRISVARQNEVAAELLQRVGAGFAPTVPTGRLNAAQRAEVAIARALRNGTPGKGVIILDESTRPLGNADRARMHEVIRKITASGTGVLFVSHDLDEVLDIGDRVTVLRDGTVVGAGLPTAEMTSESIARLMLGRAVDSMSVQQRTEAVDVVASIRDLHGTHLAGLDLDLHAGEVVGLTGSPGCGFEEVPYLISGATRAQQGSMHVGGSRLDLRRTHVHHLLRAGVALVPERRDRDGLAMVLSVRDNIGLPQLDRQNRPWFASRRAQRGHAEKAIREFDIRPPIPSRLVKELSGGNQQKVLFAKWLATAPTVLVLHEPTQAVDVGARYDLLKATRAAAASGVAVLIVSIEPTDLTAVCDRVVVYQGAGRQTELRTDDPEEILHAVYAGAPETDSQERE